MRVEDEQAFREFVAARSRSLLYTAFLLTGDREQARDLLQEALARTARRWRRLEQPEAYVRTVLYHAQVDRRRLLSWRRETPVADFPEQAGPGGDCADAVASRQDILAALKALPKGQRAVVVLRYFEDRTEAETAQVLGIGTGTVRSQLHKALGALRVSIRIEGLQPEWRAKHR